MSTEQTSPSNYSIEDLGSALKIIVPSRKYWVLIVFISVWLMGWAFGEITVATALVGIVLDLFVPLTPQDAVILEGDIPAPILLIWLIWFVIWTVGGMFAIRALLWQLVGKEVIEVDVQSITIHRQVLGLHKPKTYHLKRIRDVRIVPNRPLSTRSFYGIDDGSIAFDYGEKTVKFVSGNDEEKGREILAAIQRRFPQYQR